MSGNVEVDANLDVEINFIANMKVFVNDFVSIYLAYGHEFVYFVF